MGDNDFMPDEFNPLGYGENRDFTSMNESMLRQAGGSWKEIPRLYLLDYVFYDNLHKIIELIGKYKSDLWGWKDPRNSLFLHNYVGIVNNPHVIICWRNPYSIAKSLNKRDKISINLGLDIVTIYNSAITRHLRIIKCPVLHIKFEDYFIDPEKNCRKIEEFIGAGRVDRSLIRKELKHF